MIARVAAVAALAGAVVLVALLVLGSGPDYTLQRASSRTPAAW